MTTEADRTCALAGIIQAASLAQQLARKGEFFDVHADPSVRSILVLDAISTKAVYGGLSGLRRGLQLLADGILTTNAGEQVEILHYLMNLLLLFASLRRSNNFEEFGQRVQALSAYQGDELYRACSDVYQAFVSPLDPRIIIQGEEDYLTQTGNAEKIRTLLLAGLRSAALWEQKGGSKWKLLWGRSKLRDQAANLLRQASGEI